MQIVSDSPSTPELPISILLSPVVRLLPAPTPAAVLLLPVLLKSALSPFGRVVAAGGVVQERLITVGRVADPLIWFSESGFIGVYPWP